MAIVFDIETDGLLDDLTKIHCFSYCDGNSVKSLVDYSEIKDFLLKQKVLIGHNIIRFDIPALEKILNIKIKAKLIDTLALSWYLNVNRHLHGLESFGDDYGIKKPEIKDWKNLSLKDYINRCEEDVKINRCLWNDLRTKLLKIYDNKKDANRLLSYLSFKLECAAEAEQNRWKINLDLIQNSFDKLSEEQNTILEKLIQVMPPKEITTTKSKPKKPFKKDGSLSSQGVKWFDLLKELNVPDTTLVVDYVSGYDTPNPNSDDQIKNWLFSLGWKPTTFKYVKNKETFEERAIPQVRKDGELCESVLKLTEKEENINLLQGLTVIQHRLGIFKSFLNNQKENYLKAEIHGLTNTLRFKHKNPLVNLPGVSKQWGKEIRGSLIADLDTILCGTDMVSLEDTTKRHYMYSYDPDYVEEMSKDGFDPHLDLAKHAGVVSEEEVINYIKGNDEYKYVKDIRQNYKQANYACIYGVKEKRLSRDAGLTIKEAKELINAYWKRNWAVKKVIDDQTIKTVDGEMWLLNPVSKLYYSLRFEKDIFSTLNQGTGVYCFDSWIKEKLKLREKISNNSVLIGQFHDETIDRINIEEKDKWTKISKKAIEKVNEKLKLNIQLDVDIKFGDTYAEIH